MTDEITLDDDNVFKAIFNAYDSDGFYFEEQLKGDIVENRLFIPLFLEFKKRHIQGQKLIKLVEEQIEIKQKIKAFTSYYDYKDFIDKLMEGVKSMEELLKEAKK